MQRKKERTNLKKRRKISGESIRKQKNKGRLCEIESGETISIAKLERKQRKYKVKTKTKQNKTKKKSRT